MRARRPEHGFGIVARHFYLTACRFTFAGMIHGHRLATRVSAEPIGACSMRNAPSRCRFLEDGRFHADIARAAAGLSTSRGHFGTGGSTFSQCRERPGETRETALVRRLRATSENAREPC